MRDFLLDDDNAKEFSFYSIHTFNTARKEGSMTKDFVAN
jgi:hypothetical protein